MISESLNLGFVMGWLCQARDQGRRLETDVRFAIRVALSPENVQDGEL